jgi:hypothetical protein
MGSQFETASSVERAAASLLARFRHQPRVNPVTESQSFAPMSRRLANREPFNAPEQTLADAATAGDPSLHQMPCPTMAAFTSNVAKPSSDASLIASRHGVAS